MKIRFLLILLMVVVLSSCSEDEDEMMLDIELTDYELTVIDYFQDIALGFEFGTASRVTRKWNSDINISIGGNPSTELLEELDKIILEINELVTDGFQMQIVNDTQPSNYFIFFGSGDDYADLYPSLSNLITDNWGLFSLRFNQQNFLTSGHMYVDIVRANPALQRHLIREELTQSLGLARDSPRFRESIFLSSFSTTSSYTTLDKDLIRLLYHPDMVTGLNASQVSIVLREILLNER